MGEVISHAAAAAADEDGERGESAEADDEEEVDNRNALVDEGRVLGLDDAGVSACGDEDGEEVSEVRRSGLSGVDTRPLTMEGEEKLSGVRFTCLLRLADEG